MTPYQRKTAILMDPFFMVRAALADEPSIFKRLDYVTSLGHIYLYTTGHLTQVIYTRMVT